MKLYSLARPLTPFGLLFVVMLLSCLLLLSGCSLYTALKPVPVDHKMERYATERYMIGLGYMEQSRYELARQQFAVAAASANSLALKELAAEGYEKADRILVSQQ